MNKHKGANAERELYHMLVGNNYAVVRAAGSGMMGNTACDLIAGRKRKKYCIEVKSCKDKKKYLDKTQIEQFVLFSEIFGLKPIIALRFNREGWFFLRPKHLEKTKKGLAISLEEARKNGKRFGQAFE